MRSHALFTNAQLADMARSVPRTKASLNAIDGLGDAEVARYGEPLLGLLATFDGPEVDAASGAVAHTGPAEPEPSLAVVRTAE